MEAQQTEPEPDCRAVCGGRGGMDNSWEQVEVTERLLTWHEPCSRCFPNEDIDVDEVVKKKRRRSTYPALHRPK